MVKSQKSKVKSTKGVVCVFTGEGKGKTSAAIGVGVRAALSGLKVGMVCWYKSKNWDVAEYRLQEKFPNFQVFPMGAGFFIQSQKSKVKSQKYRIAPLLKGGKVVDYASEKEHRKAAGEALKKANELVGKVDLLILDEVNQAVEDKLIDLIDLIDLISKRGKMHLVLTGRGACKQVVEAADLVTGMRKIKHPYEQGKKAVRGLDF